MASKVYVFRRISVSATESGVWEIGIAVVKNLKDLFWTLDQFGNPYDFEFRPARPGDAVHTWQRDEREDVAADLGYMPEPESCFVTDPGPSVLNGDWPTFSEPMQDQTGDDWRPITRRMGYTPTARKAPHNHKEAST